MFRYCVWYLLREKHPINTLIKTNATLLNTVVFPGHITIKHSIEKKQDAVEMAKRFHQHKMPQLDLFSQPFLSHVSIDNTDFFAIEQMLLVNKNKVDGVHVSLAYSDRDLTSMEIVSCAPDHGFKFLPEDLNVVVYDCHSKDPSQWSLVWNNDKS